MHIQNPSILQANMHVVNLLKNRGNRKRNDPITKKDIIEMRRQQNAPKKYLIELSKSNRKKKLKTARVLRQMDGDSVSADICN